MRNKKLAWLSVLTVSSIATPMLAAACNETKDYNKLVNVKLKDQSANKLAKDVTADDIEVSSTDKTLKLKVTSVNVSATDKNSVTVIIQVRDSSSKKTHTITKILSGFKTEKGQNNSNEGGGK
ncbi:hypothetical protein E1I18_00890 [Mycoplasmopsis mucosicanis]|uniref:Lipoprotein n=1 Tax=Mycoplasmopsis mucosicanis TaxID=458208 RepID=A0A507SRX4_9BACT|nr:hypothetical protein [Mycoplasmopsis mucosicanis]TQC54001.1 hypothetical protein E1I18_00890 [Mycoplasmopsis mucosicanis]